MGGEGWRGGDGMGVFERSCEICECGREMIPFPVLCPGGTASQHSGVPRSIGIASAVVVSGLASSRE
jgi:hypothetical protein